MDIIVSNRLPVSVLPDGSFRQSDGGLVAGLGSFHGSNSLWVGCLGPISASQRRKVSSEELKRNGLLIVDMPSKLYDAYYGERSNEVYWPDFHDMQHLIRFTDNS